MVCARLRVGRDPEGRILVGQLPERSGEPFLIRLRCRLDDPGDDRLGELHGFENHRSGRRTDRLPGPRVPQTHHRRDVSGVDLLDLLALVGVDLEEAADTRPDRAGGVEDRVTGPEHPRVDPEEGELADEGIGHHLEDQRGKGSVVPRVPDRRGRVGYGRGARDRRHVRRRGQQGDDRVQKGLDTLVPESGSTEDRHQLQRDRRTAQRRRTLLGGEIPLLVPDPEGLQVALADLLDQRLPGQAGFLEALRSDLGFLVAGAENIPVIANLLHSNEIHHPFEGVLRPDRELYRRRPGAEAILHHLHDPPEVGARPVHLVHEGDPGHAVLVGLPPDRLGLRLYAGDRAEHGHRAVENPKRPFHLGGEVHVSGRIDDVDPVVLPETGRRGRGDRDPALLLLLHPVHRRGSLVNLAQLVGDARVVEDAFGGGRLARRRCAP